MAGVGSAEIDILADDSQARSKVKGFTGFLSSSFKGAAKMLSGIGMFIGIVEGIKGVVSVGATYEATMSKVQAVTRSTGDEMAQLDKLAIELGESTKFSATQAAEGMAFLGQAGFTTSQIVDSMPGLLSLAAAGGLELGRAADIASNILSGFNLEAGEMGRVSDVLALSAATANTSVEQLGYAMSYVAPVAAGAGLSMEEVAASIGVLSNSGIQGERAGTALRGMISSLQNPVGQTKVALEKLGLSMDQVNPSTNSLSEILKNLEGAGIDSATAMQLVGVEAGPGLISLLNTGSKGLETYTGELKNSKGAADEMAATMSDNLLGRWDEFTSRVETVALVIYQKMLPGLTALLNFFIKVATYLTANVGPALDVFIQLLSNIWPTVQIVGAAFVAAFGGLVTLLAPIARLILDIALAFTGWEGFAPLVIGLGAALGTLAIANKVAAGITLLRTGITLMMNPLARAILMTGLWQKAQILLNRAFLLNPFTIIIAAIAGLVAAFVVAYQKSETFRNIVNGVISSVKAAWSQGVSEIKAIIGLLADGFSIVWARIVAGWNSTVAAFQTIGSWFVSIWTTLKTNVVNLALSLWGSLQAAFNSGVAFIQNLIAPFVTFFVNSWNNLKLLVLSIVTGFLSLLVGDFEGMKLALQGIQKAIKDQVLNAWNLIKTLVLRAITNLVDNAKKLWNLLKNFVVTAAKNIKNQAVKDFNSLKTGAVNAVKNLYNSVVNYFKNLKNSATNSVKQTGTNVKNGFNTAKTNAVNAVKNLYNGVRDWIGKVPGKVTEMKNNMISVIKGINLKQMGKDAIQGFINGIHDKIGAVKRKVQDVVDGFKGKLQSALEFGSPSKVMAQYGNWTIEGFVNGADSLIGKVRDMAVNIANASIPNTDKAQSAMNLLNTMRSGGSFNIAGVVSAAGIGSQKAEPQKDLIIEVPIQLDGREIARGTYRYTSEYQNRQSSIMRKFKEV